MKVFIPAGKWGKWIDHLRLKGEHALADAAETAGTMTVGKRWPEADTPLPVVDKQFAGEGV